MALPLPVTRARGWLPRSSAWAASPASSARPCARSTRPRRSPACLIDTGANADCKPEYLVQFAIMGSIYARALFGLPEPKRRHRLERRRGR